ncbi:MAG: hypothetical protein K2K06_10045 [Oscillospiraceae bacterium]|nr:hypothetical protein [Oscillospiraceae bacterium]
MQKKKIVYPELEAQLAKKGCYKMELAKMLGIMPRTLSNKMSGVSHFTIEEAMKIRDEWFSDIPIEKLFRKRNSIHGIAIEIGASSDK